ncbi:MAG TPA: hypothetical protein DHW82_13560 [Spirochaetia bacterium]|nr:MAG: hypothetical protein A2Y41_09210 [Spirochaetes bacterium GWB1_36_13]HCL58016.1 hypothetical protein [Spirochaetia bacterium]
MNEKIIEAVVYQDRALVTREIIMDVTRGENRVFFQNLPPTLYANSIRVKGEGSVPVRIEGQEIRFEEKEKTANEKIRAIDDELEKINKTILLLEEKEKIYRSYFPLFEKLVLKTDNKILGFDYQRPALNDIKELRHFVKETGKAHDEKITALIQEKRSWQIKKEKLLHDQKMVEESRHITLQHCEVTLSCEKEGSVCLKLSYLAPRASWVPFYEARLFFKTQELEMVSFAKISQKTGEEWEDIKISLSSATPSAGASLPDFDTWFIDFYHPPLRKMSPKMEKKKVCSSPSVFRKEKEVEMPAEEKERMDLDDEICSSEVLKTEIACFDESPLEIEGEGESASETNLSSVLSEGLNVSFEIPKKESIGSDGTWKKTGIDKKRFPVKIETIIMPQIAENAFIQVKMLNTNLYPFLSGDVFVFHEMDYIGKSSIPKTVMPSDELKLFMGRDEEIKVKTFLLNRFQSKKGMIQNQTRIEYKYKTTITSYKDKEIDVIVLDSLPVASNSQIKVKLVETNPVHQKLDDKGVVRWEIKLKPNEEKEIYFSFTVDYPEDKTVYGLR